MRRRSFIKLFGAVGCSAALAGCQINTEQPEENTITDVTLSQSKVSTEIEPNLYTVELFTENEVVISGVIQADSTCDVIEITSGPSYDGEDISLSIESNEKPGSNCQDVQIFIEYRMQIFYSGSIPQSITVNGDKTEISDPFPVERTPP